MNKKFAFGVDPSKKPTFKPQPVRKSVFGSKQSVWSKPKPAQPKVEIPKADWGTSSTETTQSAFSKSPEFYIYVKYENKDDETDTHEIGKDKVNNNTTLGEIKNGYC